MIASRDESPLSPTSTLDHTSPEMLGLKRSSAFGKKKQPTTTTTTCSSHSQGAQVNLIKQEHRRGEHEHEPEQEQEQEHEHTQEHEHEQDQGHSLAVTRLPPRPASEPRGWADVAQPKAEVTTDTRRHAMRAALAATSVAAPVSLSCITSPDLREHVSLVFIGHAEAGKSTLIETALALARTRQQQEGANADPTPTTPSGTKLEKHISKLDWMIDVDEDVSGRSDDATPVPPAPPVNEPHALQPAVAALTPQGGGGGGCGQTFQSSQKRYTVLEAPTGNVPAIMSGMCRADVSILVVSARKGEFERANFHNWCKDGGGQAREDAMLSKTLVASKTLLVAVNKMDHASVGYSKACFDKCVSSVKRCLKGAGYDLEREIVFVPVSALSATNLLERSDTLPWYKGPTFIEALDALPTFERNTRSPLRLTVVSSYWDVGTTVEGKVEQGTIKAGDRLSVFGPRPGGQGTSRVSVEVTSVWQGQHQVTHLKAGENARIKLKGISDDEIQPGFVISPLGAAACSAFNRFEAQFVVLAMPEKAPTSTFRAGCTATLHSNGTAVACKVVEITRTFGQKIIFASPEAAVVSVGKGTVIVCVIEAEQALCIEKENHCRQLGRFILRNEADGITIGFGKVLDCINHAPDDAGTGTDSDIDSDTEIPRALSDL